MKKLVNVTLMFCVLSGMSACATLNGDPVDRADRLANALAPRTPKTPFDEAFAKAALKPGKVEIKSVLVNCYGRGVACMQGSIPVINTHVYLYPYTPYLQEYLDMDKQLQADIKKHREYSTVKINLDPKFSQYSLTAKTDEYGRYGFKGVKPGKYYVLSERATGHRTVVGHYYDDYGVDHPRQVDSPAELEFYKTLEISQNSGVYKFESQMQIIQINGLR
jgi:hypothetical protein